MLVTIVPVLGRVIRAPPDSACKGDGWAGNAGTVEVGLLSRGGAARRACTAILALPADMLKVRYDFDNVYVWEQNGSL